MLKLLIFTSLFPNPEQPLRGNFVASLVQEMSKLAEITVVSPLPYFPNIPFLKTSGGMSNKLSRYNQNWNQYSKIPFFSQCNGFDVYYPKYPFIPVVSRAIHPALMTLAVSSLMKRLIKEKSIDIINAHWIYPDGIAAVWISTKLGIPVIVTAHGSDINIYSSYKLRKPQVRWALKKADRVITVSNALSEKVVKELNIDRENIAVIPNGVDISKFRSRNKEDVRRLLGLKQDGRYLLFVGRFHEVKGLEYLIEALSIFNRRGDLSFETILVGDGPLKDDLLRWVKSNNLSEKIIFTGEKSNSEIPLWMNACNILCLPSLQEGNPCVVLEALACGLPVIASSVGGIPELINRENGILVKPRNPVSLIEAIKSAFEKNWNSDSISRNIQEFSWTESAQKYLEIFEEILLKK